MSGVEQNKMSILEAMTLLTNGKKLRDKRWPEGEYIFINTQTGKLLDQDLNERILTPEMDLVVYSHKVDIEFKFFIVKEKHQNYWYPRFLEADEDPGEVFKGKLWVNAGEQTVSVDEDLLQKFKNILTTKKKFRNDDDEDEY